MLNISDANRNIIVLELRFVLNQMRLAPTDADKMYFLSGATGMIQRIFNLDFDAELLFAHQVLTVVRDQINGRISQPMLPPQISGTIMSQVISRVEASIEELANRWQNGQGIGDLLQDLAVLSYAASGNGHYLITKGVFKIQPASIAPPPPS